MPLGSPRALSLRFDWRNPASYATPDVATVREVMSTNVITVDPDDTVAEAATVMGGKRVGSALIMDGDRIAGIFTERDIVRALGEHFDAAGHPVSNWMTRSPSTIAPDASVEEALNHRLAEVRDKAELKRKFDQYCTLRPEDKIRLAMDILWDVNEKWDNDTLVTYPEDLPSFDEYLAEIGSKLYDIAWK